MRLRSRQSGVGLIEVLVALLVLSIGLLGLAALQTRALSDNNSSMTQSMAAVAAYSILEAMRTDSANALSGSYNTTVTASSCPSSGSSLAAYQLNAWCTLLGSYLGAVSTTTGTIALSGNEFTITITYSDSKVTGGSTTQPLTFVTKAEL